MEADREVELKLSIPPERLAGLMRSPRLRAPASNRAVTRALRNVYYDTSKLALRDQGMVLRVREAGRRYVQTLKVASGSPVGLFRRREWETPLLQPQPDLSRLRRFPDLHGPLSPVFRSEIRRTTRTLQLGNRASVEVAIDRGAVETPNAAAPVCEIELELRNGDADALFDLALALNEMAPLRLMTASKSDRGYLMLRGGQVESSRAAPLRLETAMTAGDALSAMLRHGLGHLLANEAAARQGLDPEGVHQMRLALRRLRSALAAFRTLMPQDTTERLRGELKWLAGELTSARDLDVFLEELHAPLLAAFPQDAGLQQLGALARTARAAAYERVRAVCGTTRYTALLIKLSRLAETRGWQEQLGPEAVTGLGAPALEFASDLLSQRHQKARKRGRRLRALSTDERHVLRLAVKKLRYAADAFRTLYVGEATRGYLKRLARLQDQLGFLNDLETACGLVDRFVSENGAQDATRLARAGGLLIGWHARRAKRATRRLGKDWKMFKTVPPFWIKTAA